MICHRCGSAIPDNSASCATCGLKLVGGAAGAAPRRRATVDAPYKPGDVFAGRYAIRGVLGPGPVGHVFRAQDQEMDVEVALKIINPRLVQMQEERTQFSLALRAGKKLTHPHHVRVYEEGEDKSRPFFTTQLLEGTSLRRRMEQRLAQGQRFTLKEVEGLLAPLVEALDNAHRYGPHSDLKPENIFLQPDLLKVTDYGLALGIPRLPYIQAQKTWKVACYLAPEYFEGGELDTRMDLYALGVIMGELLTGQTPEEGEVPELLAYESELPAGIEALYRRATNANPLARPKSATDFLSDFIAALSSRPRPSSASRPAAPASARARGNKPGVPFSLTADLAMAPAPSTHGLLPPVPTSELPALGSPTQQVPTVGPPSEEEATRTELERPRDQEDATRTELEPRRTDDDARTKVDSPRRTQESPPSPAPAASTLEMPRSREDEAPPPDATQKLDSEALAAIMETARPSAPAPTARTTRQMPASRPASATKSLPKGSVRSPVPRTDPIVPVRPSLVSRLWIPLLTVGGLGLGALAGYGLLKWRQSHTPPATSLNVPAVAAPRDDATGVRVGPGAGCPPGMRRVSGGSFKMGRESAREGTDAEPVLMYQQVATFCIDEFEFPNQVGVLPRVNVTWSEAQAECTRLGKRLCREAEWEKACKGPGNQRFPYSPTFDVQACNVQGQRDAPAAAGAFAQCRSGYGVADLSGNVAEWTDSSVGGADRVQKGGAFNQQQISVRCAIRQTALPDASSPTVGFRCCKGET